MFSALILACEKREIWLRQSLAFMDEQNFSFVEKVVSFFGVMSDSLRAELSGRGWKIIGNSKSRAAAMNEGLTFITQPITFYNEDDVLVKLPTETDLKVLFSLYCRGRETGLVSLSLGGSTHDFPKKQFGDLKEIKENVFWEDENTLAFLRQEQKASPWFIEFPALFIRTQILKTILDSKISNHEVEIQLTKNYFDQKLSDTYLKLSLCKKNVFEVVAWYENNFNYEMLETAKLTKLLDPNQGGAFFDLAKIPNL